MGIYQFLAYRSCRVEQRQSRQDDQKKFETLEKLYLDVSMDVDKEYERSRKSFNVSTRKLADIDDGEELWHYMETSNDMEVRLRVKSLRHSKV